MTLGNKIAQCRRKLGLTQEALAQMLEVTNQAVSKWETDQCCPDTMLLPKLAEIFGITIDELFGRESAPKGEGKTPEEAPWEDDEAFRIFVFQGRRMLQKQPANLNCHFTFDGPAKDVYCMVNLECGDVAGNISASGSVECGDVAGELSAGGYVECGDVAGNVTAGSYVECGDVGGGINAGTYVECGDVQGDLAAGGYVECGDVGGSVTAHQGYVECGDVGGGKVAAKPIFGDLNFDFPDIFGKKK